MIETRRLENVVIFIQTVLSFVLSRKISNTFFVFMCVVETVLLLLIFFEYLKRCCIFCILL